MRFLRAPATRLAPRFVWPFLGVFIGLRLVFWVATFPNPDEAYYWLWGQHPALSYYDHPALEAWMQGLFTAIFGRSTVTLRLPNLITNALFFYTYYRITRYLYGDSPGHFWLVVLVVLASPLYFLFLALAWPDHLLITLSLVAAYLCIRFLDGYSADGKGETWRLYGAAGTIALAGLAKYNAVFVAVGLGAAILADRRLRPLWRDRRLYIAIAIAASALIPIVLWNVSNDFQSFRYYASRSVGTSGFSLRPFSCVGFLLFSVLTVSPFSCFALLRHRQQLRNLCPDSVYLSVAFWVFASSTVTLTVISLLSAALYYWNITAYLLLWPLLPAVLQRSTDGNERTLSSDRPRWRRRLLIAGQCYGVLFAALLVIHYSVLPLSALFDKETDPDSRMLFGWSQVAAVVREQAATLSDRPFLATTDYRSASALAYALNRSDVTALSDRVDQFDFWYTSDAAFKGRDAVLLADDWHPFVPERLAQFARTSGPVTVPVTRWGIWIKNYYVLKGYAFKGGKVS